MLLIMGVKYCWAGRDWIPVTIVAYRRVVNHVKKSGSGLPARGCAGQCVGWSIGRHSIASTV